MEMQERNKMFTNSPDLFKELKASAISPLLPRTDADGKVNFQDIDGLLVPELQENSFLEDGNPFDISNEFIQIQNKTIVVLEYYKLELVQILPEIKQAHLSSYNKYKANQKKLNKKQKQLKTTLTDTLSEILQAQIEQEQAHAQFTSVANFQTFLSEQLNKQNQKSARICELNDDIGKAIKYTFSSEEEQQKSEKDETQLLNINIDAHKVDRELYKKIISKFFACIRYQMYAKIKKYWTENKDAIIPEFERRRAEARAREPQEDESAIEDLPHNPIQEEQILQIAQEIDMNNLKKQVIDLFNVDYSFTPDVALFFQKMEYVFQKTPPLNEDFLNYIDCLTTAQNEMLELIYDPRNKFVAMEENPIDSKDLMYGVPREFKDIFDEVTQTFQQSMS